MKRTAALGVFVLTAAVVFATASARDAYAQDPKGGGGGGGGQGGGAGASPRGGGGDAGGSRGGGSVASAPAPSSGGYTGGGPVFSGGGTSGGNSGMSAVPRGAGRTYDGAGGRQPGGASPRWTGSGSAVEREGRPAEGGSFRRSPVDDQMAGRSRAGAGSSGVESSAPWYARTRGANPSTGTAVPRSEGTLKPPGGGGGYPVYPGYPGYPGYGYGYGGGYYDCYYYPYGCNAWGYGAFGLGYFYFDPFGWNYADYSFWGGGGGGGGTYGGQQMGSIRLRVKPNNASVYVDGYYAGTVDDFDNSFQKLSLALGTHKIEISAPGYRPLIVEIEVRDFDTINFQGALEPIR